MNTRTAVTGSCIAVVLALVLAGCAKPGCPGGVCKGGGPVIGGGAADGGADIGTPALRALLASDANPLVFDARSGKYDDGRRIPGARSLASDAPEATIRKAIKDKNALIVTYCANLKCPASRRLAKRLGELGYKNVLEYPQGIAGWVAAGNEVQKEK